MRKLYRCLCYVLFIQTMACVSITPLSGQNIVPNPSFETSGTSAPGFPPWLNAGNGTTDHYQAPVSAPVNLLGYQWPHAGNAYVGAFIGRTGGGTAENFTSTLLTPMISGHKYLVSMYVSLADKSRYGIDRIGILFTTNMVLAPGGSSIFALPSVTNPDYNYIVDTAGWTKLQWLYTAAGNEQWINIGSFAPSGGNSWGHDTLAYPNSTWNSSYCYFDDICVLDLMGTPLASSRVDTVICNFPASVSYQGLATKYLWNNGDTTASIQINTPGTFWVKSFGECSFNIDTFVVNFGIPTNSKRTIDTFLCKDAQMTLSTPATAQNITWSTGSNAATQSIALSGTYWVTYSTSNCNLYTDTFKVHDAAIETFNIPDTLVCNQGLLQVRLPDNFRSQTWSDGTTAHYFTVSNSGKYWVEATTMHYCILKDTFDVTLIDTRQKFRDTMVCNNEPFHLQLQLQASNTSSIQWQDGSTATWYNITRPGKYSVTVTDSLCSSISTITINEEYCDCPFLVPNAFSPNGDGLNDDFGLRVPDGCEVRGYLLIIFNRWGQKVFQSYNVNKKWNGYLNGLPQEAGTYFYDMKFEAGTKSNLYTRKGDITLVR